jgi:hypothetical protein
MMMMMMMVMYKIKAKRKISGFPHERDRKPDQVGGEKGSAGDLKWRICTNCPDELHRRSPSYMVDGLKRAEFCAIPANIIDRTAVNGFKLYSSVIIGLNQ